ncbi:MAG TPA: 3'(2'),5'-bisphosphate nucleotidase CysQ [Rickettsia endosymbiont of Proechinophthirus fluctus]|uniref:3'(2'),5'-bisphosphate nucleotidase CysQ family protein n=1 Tax=Rickettsia endosymbiont of Proechinophthirus fluctus TaxID=1462733 RepID=UPI000789EA09|nr:3'(2'),5'-bisphosphate nucleotidase CysQ [Rickettsia endosymbiont of Proechinophthirus fluctus]KYP97958.1 3'-5'-bisphosphate nucleotidase [Rickettsia endosymbiont of Proechinophthirus fluctus]HJD54358.1 3'(2'),5'-bisphosphate nucleotidase CysQ [Rickettsia endosymbiont of Proechinophthirus fluctus]
MNDNLINALKDLIINTGKIALDIKKAGMLTDIKSDGAVVTNADKEISKIIYQTLQTLTSQIAIVCEEQPLPIFSSDTFWLIDPIDGTWSYVNGKSTYTVNIGLIENGVPTIGLIYHPETAKLYYTDVNGRLKIEQNSKEIFVNHEPKHEELHAVIGFCNSNKATKEFLSKYSFGQINAIGSSMKLCLIAEGAADIYPKFGQTMEWDIAAGHALIKAGGGNILDTHGQEITYGKESFANPHFFACSKYWLEREARLYRY